MKKPTIRFNFSTFTDGMLVPFAQGVLTSLQDNKHFTTPTPALNTLEKALDGYADSIPANNLRNMANSALKREKKAELIQLLRQLAHYINLTANGDMEALYSSGFHLGNQRQAAGTMPMPADIQLQPGLNAGELIASCKSQTGARLYEARASQDGESWTWFAANTRGELLFQELPTEQKAWVQVRLKSSAGYGPWSQPVQGRIG